MATRQKTPWSNEEVQTFLCVVAEERIQRELDGATRNEKVYQEVSERMSKLGFNRTSQQCREKLKKLKSNYRAVKDAHNDRSGSNRKSWKWYEQMDGIYGQKPASNGNEGGHSPESNGNEGGHSPESNGREGNVTLDSATSLLESPMEDGRRKRRREPEHLTVLREMQTSDVEQQELNRAQRERHFQMTLEDAAQARELEAALRREEIAAMSSFNQALLGTLSQLVQALNRRDAAVPPPLD